MDELKRWSANSIERDSDVRDRQQEEFVWSYAMSFKTRARLFWCLSVTRTEKSIVFNQTHKQSRFNQQKTSLKNISSL